MVAYVLSQFPSLSENAGLTGYMYFFPAFPNPFGGNSTLAGTLLSMALLDSTPDAATKLFTPVLDHINATWPGVFTFGFLPREYSSFYAFFQENHDTNPAGKNQFIGSRLLDRRALTKNLTANAAAFKTVALAGAGVVHLVSGKGVRDAKPRGGGNAVLPAWRKSYVHLSRYHCLLLPSDAVLKSEED